MTSLGLRLTTTLRRRGGYASKVLSIFGNDLLAYWPMQEASGTNADNAEGTAARDGTYTGVTLADLTLANGDVAPLWDGTNDYCDVYSDSLRDAFDGDEGTLAIFAQVENASVLTDGANRRAANLTADASNRIRLGRQSGDNQIRFEYSAGGTSEIRVITPGDTDLMHLGITWSASAGASGEVKFWYKGSQSGTTQTGLGTWAGTLASSGTLIGADTATPGNPWQGWLAHCVVATRAATADEMTALAKL